MATERVSSRREKLRMQEYLKVIKDMTVGELQQEHLALFGERTRSRNKPHLQRKVLHKAQELREGGLSDRARQRIQELIDAGIVHDLVVPNLERAPRQARRRPHADVPRKARDPRLPEPGSVLSREHKGALHEVTVGEDHFVYRGERYKSLSTIAREITGTPWNGFTFFGIGKRGVNRRKESA